MSKPFKLVILNIAIIVAALLVIHYCSLYFVYAAKGATVQYINIDKLIFTMRNIDKLLAVGALHLAGEEGLLNLLKEAGYTVEPVKF